MNKSRTNKTLWIVALVIILAAGALAAWKLHAVQPQGTVKLGVIAGTTGDYAAAGEGYTKGFELARKEWNKSHALQFTDVIEDDGFNAQKGVNAYHKLRDADAVDAYAVLSSFTIDATKDDLIKEGKPVALGFEQSTPAQDDNIIQVLPAARPIQEGLGKHLKELGYKKPLVIISNNTPVYANFYAGFADGFGAGAQKEEINSDIATIRAVAARAKADAPDVIVIYSDPPSGALAARELIRTFGAAIPQLAFDQSIQSGITDYQQVFGKSMTPLNGAMVALSKNDFTDSFKQTYQQAYGTQPPFASDMGYNAFTLLARSYSSNASQWVRTMQSARFTGADGDVSFDATGLRVPNVYFATLTDGTIK